MKAFITLAALALTACGSEKTETKFQAPPQAAQQPLQWGSLMLDNAAALPACSAERKGWLAYLKDSGQFQACDGSVWSVVDIKGKDGAAGVTGKDGKNGTDNKLVSSKYCSAVAGDLIVSLKVSTTTSGDVFTSCSVASSYSVISGSDVWAADSTGAEKGNCRIDADFDHNNDYGSFQFDSTGAILKSSPTAQPVAIVFEQQNCRSN